VAAFALGARAGAALARALAGAAFGVAFGVLAALAAGAFVLAIVISRSVRLEGRCLESCYFFDVGCSSRGVASSAVGSS